MRFSIIQLKQLSEDSEVSGNKLRNFKLLAFLEGAGIVYTGGRRRRRRGILQDARSQPGMEWLSNDEYSRKRRFMRIRTRVSDNARVYLYTSSFPFRSLHSAHSARRYSYPDRIVLRSPGRRIHGYGRRHNWSTARQYPGAKQMRKVRCFLSPSTESCDGRRPSYRSQPFQTSIGQESSTLFYARLTLVSSLQTDPS